jgi:peptide/nickel transport system substrate-binding protein
MKPYRILMALVLVLAAGCAAQPSAGQSVRRIPAYDINPRPRADLKRGGTLRWPLPDFPVQWNFHHVNGAKGEVDDVVRGLLPYTMRTDERAVPHPDRDYVLSATVRRSGAGQIVTYTINPKATWSDGTPITYKDFAGQARALSGRDHRYEIASSTGYSEISQVRRGRDDRQAVVRFARSYADWPGLFAPLYPASANGDPAAFDTGWLNKIPVTAGPFKLVGIDQTAKTITLVRDPRWWGPPALLDSIVFRVMDLSTMPGAFANGEIDLFDIGGDAGAYAQARQVRGAVVRRAGGPDWRQLTLNAGGPLLSDPLVRQAVRLGIDRSAIARSDLTGLDWPLQTLGNHFFVNTQAGYQDHGSGYDPVRAGRLLDQAGWKLAGGKRIKGGRVLALRMVVPSGAPTSRQEAELVQAMLRQVGIQVTIQGVPDDDLFDKYVVPGDFDIVPFSWLGTPYPVSSNRSIFASVQGGRLQQNYARAGSSRIDTLMDEALRTLDPAAARRLTNEADRLVWQQGAVLPLFQRPQLVAVTGRLANFGARGFYDLAYEDIGFTS